VTPGVERPTSQFEVCLVGRTDVNNVRLLTSEKLVEVCIPTSLKAEQIAQLPGCVRQNFCSSAKHGNYV
jgi:hypothetical protein